MEPTLTTRMMAATMRTKSTTLSRRTNLICEFVTVAVHTSEVGGLLVMYDVSSNVILHPFEGKHLDGRTDGE